jgi:deazaflavin-dependent oxidoreductase (nitroreductase family)
MVRRLVAFIGVLVLGGLAWLGFIVVAMRTGSPRLLAVVRRFNRDFTNKLQARSAGTPGAYASVIQHRGRNSGRTYDTPIVPFATDDGFVIVLPYGRNVDWLKNVLAAGQAVLVTGGHTYTVDRPEIVPVDSVEDAFPPNEQRTHRVFGVKEAVRVRRQCDAGASIGERGPAPM